MNPLNPEDIDDLKQLIEFLKENQVAEFELDRGDLKVRLKFTRPETANAGLGDLASLLANARTAAPAPVVAAAPVTVAAPAAAAAPAADPNEGLHILKSPIVGTYYGSPSPGASPFVMVGDRVEKGQVICIVEAMKLMNEIESDAAGEIVKSFVSNGQPIEFGQPLFAIRQG
ncbi:MAG: acetyl-CoA carboxylase biotin carboxyl carrier protein [Terracidiphilus sp.]|jgi:acetyl-CoA carboxylase biotin carboxyl carrier protein